MKKIILILFLIMFCSESRKTIIESIIKSAENVSEKEFRIADFTKFEWDVMYVRWGYIDFAALSKEMNINYDSNIPEDTMRLIFLKNGKVVYEEDYKSTRNMPEVYFDLNDLKGKNDSIYSKNEDHFVITKRKYNDCNQCFEYFINSGLRR